MEHAWLLGDSAAAEDMLGARAVFLSLLDATVPSDQRRDMLYKRIEAKHAQAMLLTMASFSDDLSKSTRAQERAQYFLARCRDMLLDS